MSFFSSGTSGPKKPFSSLPSVVSWFIRPVTTATGSAVQQLPLLPKFHEFVKHLCEIAGVNKGQNHSLLFRKACLSFLIANQNNKNGTSKQIIAWMGKMTNHKAQNAIKARLIYKRAILTKLSPRKRIRKWWLGLHLTTLTPCSFSKKKTIF